MSNKCKACGKNCIDCDCDTNKVKKLFDEKLMGGTPISPFTNTDKFIKFSTRSGEDDEEDELYEEKDYSRMIFFSKDAEDRFCEMTDRELRNVARNMAKECIKSQEEIIYEKMLEVKYPKDSPAQIASYSRSKASCGQNATSRA